jgi:hypothetical protein
MRGANVSMQFTPSWIRFVKKLMPNIIFSIATIRSLLSLTSFPFRMMYPNDDDAYKDRRKKEEHCWSAIL